MMFNPNANDPIDKSNLTQIARDIQGLRAFAGWEQSSSGDFTIPSPNALPIYKIFPINGSPQELSFMQNTPGYVPNIGWTHELLIRVLIHNMESQPPHQDVDVGRSQHKAIECLRDALSHLLGATAMQVSLEQEQASWEGNRS